MQLYIDTSRIFRGQIWGILKWYIQDSMHSIRYVGMIGRRDDCVYNNMGIFCNGVKCEIVFQQSRTFKVRIESLKKPR